MTKIIENQNFESLYDVCTEKGFEKIFKNIITSIEDPRMRLLKFEENDHMKIKPVNVQVATKDGW
jgi:hypothetical protein